MSELRNAIPNVKTELPGPVTKKALEKRKKVMPSAIKSVYPLSIARGEGAMFEDLDGNIFLDWVGGVGVLNIGYSHPKVINSVKKQSEKYFHSMMNIVTHDKYLECAEVINEIAPVRGVENQTMFTNSGAEAVENAVKIAKGVTGRPNIIVFTGAFHGRTSLAMTMTAKKSYAYGMGPFPDGVYRAEYPYIYRRPKGMNENDAIDYYIESIAKVFDYQTPPEHTAAIVFEPIQGEGGFIPAPIEWVKAIREICDKHGILMICDEIQTGFGRSGRMFVSDYYKEKNIHPDIMVFAKSVAGGIPLGGVVASEDIMESVPIGTIGGTYSGNAVACAAALAVIDVMKSEDYPAKARYISDKFINKINALKSKYKEIGDVRGIGAMIGVEFVKDDDKTPNADIVNDIVKRAWEKGLVLESAGIYGNVIRFLCPLCVTNEQLECGLKIFEQCIEESLNAN